MRWCMATHGKGSEKEPGELSGYAVSLTLLQNTVHPAKYKHYQLRHTL